MDCSSKGEFGKSFDEYLFVMGFSNTACFKNSRVLSFVCAVVFRDDVPFVCVIPIFPVEQNSSCSCAVSAGPVASKVNLSDVNHSQPLK